MTSQSKSQLARVFNFTSVLTTAVFIAVVGFSKPVVINHEEQFAGNQKLVDKKKVVEELILIARAEGKIAAK